MLARHTLETAAVLVCFVAFRVASGARWYNYRMMRNPGLVSVSATNQFDCVAQCQSTTGCSAISWNPTTLTCLKSMCNNLDLYGTTGWNTYVLTDAYCESASMPAASLDWMLTDTCGNSSQGILNGPKMNFYSSTYSNPLSAYSGASTTFNGALTSYGVTDASSAVNFPMNNQSLTVMFWVRFDQVYQIGSTLLEFRPLLSSRDMVYWVLGGIYTESMIQRSSNGYSPVSNPVVYVFTPTLSKWYHMAFVYDGLNGVQTAYLNYSVVGIQQYRFVNVFNNWQYVAIGKCATCSGNNNFPGSISCVKVFSVALSAQQVQAFGDSCMVGKVRLSN